MRQGKMSQAVVCATALLVGGWLVACSGSDGSSRAGGSIDFSVKRRTPGAPPPARGPVAYSDTTCIVSRIVDGDSFECTGRVRVRLIGIDAPENSQGADGAKAKAALTKLMPAGQPVRLQFDRRREDQYGRLLAYGWSGATLVNEAMVAGGWTLAGIYPPNVMYTRRLEAAEESARERKAGMWATGGFSCRPADRRGRRC